MLVSRKAFNLASKGIVKTWDTATTVPYQLQYHTIASRKLARSRSQARQLAIEDPPDQRKASIGHARCSPPNMETPPGPNNAETPHTNAPLSYKSESWTYSHFLHGRGPSMRLLRTGSTDTESCLNRQRAANGNLSTDDASKPLSPLTSSGSDALTIF